MKNVLKVCGNRKILGFVNIKIHKIIGHDLTENDLIRWLGSEIFCAFMVLRPQSLTF